MSALPKMFEFVQGETKYLSENQQVNSFPVAGTIVGLVAVAPGGGGNCAHLRILKLRFRQQFS